MSKASLVITATVLLILQLYFLRVSSFLIKETDLIDAFCFQVKRTAFIWEGIEFYFSPHFYLFITSASFSSKVLCCFSCLISSMFLNTLVGKSWLFYSRNSLFIYMGWKGEFCMGSCSDWFQLDLPQHKVLIKQHIFQGKSICATFLRESQPTL
jgi:hypothetical protein